LGVKIVFKKLSVSMSPRPDERWLLDREVEDKLGLAPRFPTCLMTWDQPSVHSDGTVFPCCAVSDRRFSLGSILEESMEAIWSKPLAVAMRRYLKTGLKPKMELPCYACPWNPNGGALR
jgi:radical SAM protein with 4Fe4S-binding SPASM domain